MAKLAADTLPSIVSVDVTLWHHVYPDDRLDSKKQYDARVREVKSAKKKKSTKKVKSATRSSRGFFIATNGEKNRILTCAHTMDDCYSPHVEDLPAESANCYFKFENTCSHQDMEIHNNPGIRDISVMKRSKTAANCIALC